MLYPGISFLSVTVCLEPAATPIQLNILCILNQAHVEVLSGALDISPTP